MWSVSPEKCLDTPQSTKTRNESHFAPSNSGSVHPRITVAVGTAEPARGCASSAGLDQDAGRLTGPSRCQVDFVQFAGRRRTIIIIAIGRRGSRRSGRASAAAGTSTIASAAAAASIPNISSKRIERPMRHCHRRFHRSCA